MLDLKTTDLETYAKHREQSLLGALVLCALDAAIEGAAVLGVIALAAYFADEATSVGRSTLLIGWIILALINAAVWRASIASDRFCNKIKAIGSIWSRSAS